VLLRFQNQRKIRRASEPAVVKLNITIEQWCDVASAANTVPADQLKGRKFRIHLRLREQPVESWLQILAFREAIFS
jgi:hypothetical protein